jgi:hypothetical protein
MERYILELPDWHVFGKKWESNPLYPKNARWLVDMVLKQWVKYYIRISSKMTYFSPSFSVSFFILLLFFFHSFSFVVPLKPALKPNWLTSRQALVAWSRRRAGRSRERQLQGNRQLWLTVINEIIIHGFRESFCLFLYGTAWSGIFSLDVWWSS